MGATISVGEKSKSITDVVKELQEELARIKEENASLKDQQNSLLGENNTLLTSNNELLNANNELLNVNNELLQNFDSSDNESNNEELNAIIEQLQSDVESVVSAYNNLEDAYDDLEKTYISTDKTYTMVSENNEFGTKTYSEILRVNFVPDSTEETTGTRIRLSAMPSSDFINNWDGDKGNLQGKIDEEESQEKVIERKEFVVFENTEDNSDKIALTIHFVADGETEYDVYNATDLYHIVKDENDTTVTVNVNE